MIIRFISVFYLSACVSLVFAAQEKFTVKVYGNNRTSDNVIINEVRDLVHFDLSSSIALEVKRRIWNLQTFSSVKVLIQNKSIEIFVKERWTTIPIAKFSSGGGTSYSAFGFFDINTLGLYKEVGVQYEQLNGAPAAVVWYRDSQFLSDRNLKVGIDLWNFNRVRSFYDTGGDEIGAYTLRRRRANIFFERKTNDDRMTFGGRFDLHNDDISDFGLSNEVKSKNRANNFQFESKDQSIFYSLYFKYGRLDIQNYLVSGFQASSYISLQDFKNRDSNIFTTNLRINIKAYHLRENHFNFGWQFQVISDSNDQIQYQNYIGGFSEVRGYRDGQFYDQAYWQNNLEFRFDILESSLAVIQGIVFNDVAKEGRTISAVSKSKDEVLLSSGFGMRFISPKIYSFVGRVDYAITHTRFIDQNLSLGVQQFF